MAERGSTAASVSGAGLWLLSLLGRGLGTRTRIEAGVVRASGRWPNLREQRRPLLGAAGGLGLWVPGAVLHEVWPWLWPLALGVGVAGAALLWRLGRGRRPMAAAGAAGAWLALCWYWPAAGAVAWLGGTALVVGRVAWSIVRRMDLEANAKLARVLAEWERRVVPAARLTGARVLSGESDRVGLRLHVQLPLGLTLGEVQTSRLEHVLDHVIGGLKPDSVRISRDPEGASRCIVRVQLKTPLARSVEWPAPSELGSIKDPIALGVSESGQPVTICLLPKAGEGLNVFKCGMKGSGKSMLLNVLIGSLVYCRDVVIWGVDLKHGMELRPWERCLDRFVTEPEEARELIAAAIRIERARGRELARRGKRAWEPTPQEPELVIVIDELADLEDMSGLFQLARKARAVGIHLILATQRPSREALGEGSTDLRAQIDVFVGLRISRPEDANIVFGSGMGGRGWQPHMFNGPLYPGNGYFLISSPQHGGPEPARCYLVTDGMVAAAARPCGEGSRPRLDERSERAAGPLSLGLVADDEELPELAPEERLWAALERAPRDGAAAPDLVQETGMSRGWVMERLKHYVQQGRVQRVGHGRYRIAREGEEG